MTDPDYRALCAELTNELQGYKVAHPMHCRALLNRARAALAQPDPISKLVSQCRPLEPEMAEYLTPQARWRLYGDEAQPEPETPTDEELLELMPEEMRDDLAELSRIAAQHHGLKPGIFRVVLNTNVMAYARAVLARYGTPANNTGGTH